MKLFKSQIKNCELNFEKIKEEKQKNSHQKQTYKMIKVKMTRKTM